MRRLSTLAAALAVAALPAPALAASDTTSVALSAGTLDFSVAPTADDFPATTLTGSSQTITTNFNSWSVNDARGSGAGWNVTVQASQFSDSGSGATLPAGSLKLKAPTLITPGLGNLSTAPTVQGSPPWTIDSGSAVKVVSAATGAGKGLWNFTQANLVTGKDLQLTIPPDAAAGTYTSTITSTLSSGP